MQRFISLRAVRKGRLHKMAKNYPPPLSEKCPHWLNPPCPCGYTINFEKSYVFCTKKCGRSHPKKPLSPLFENCPHWTNPLSPVCGRPFGRSLRTTIMFPYKFLYNKSFQKDCLLTCNLIPSIALSNLQMLAMTAVFIQ